MSKPINRWTEQINSSQYKVYSRSNPHYYQDKTGSLHSINQYYSQSKSNGNISSFQLYDKNINSVGIRKDNNQTKYFGIRPDETQEDGSQQMEWSLKSANVNGESISLDLSKYDINGNVVNLGNVAVQTSRQFARQMLHYTGSITNFELKYNLHLTGLHISNSKYTSETVIRNDISGSGTITASTDCYLPDNDNRFHILDSNNELKYLITPPVLLNSDFATVTRQTTHTLKDNGDGTYEYTKYPSDLLLSGSSPFDTSINYIDSTTVYSTAASDGVVGLNYEDQNAGVNFTDQISAWNRDHDWSPGDDGTSYVEAITDESLVYFGCRKNTLSFGGTFYRFDIWKSFLYFDVSDIDGVVDGSLSSLNLYGFNSSSFESVNQYSGSIGGFAGVKSLAGSTLNTSDLNNVDGFEDGWEARVDSTLYLDEMPGNNDSTWDTTKIVSGSYGSWKINQTAASDIKNNDNFQICLMNNYNDYNDHYYMPGASAGFTIVGEMDLTSSFYASDQSGTDKDPYLLINLKQQGLLHLKDGTMKLSSGVLRFDLNQ